MNLFKEFQNLMSEQEEWAHYNAREKADSGSGYAEFFMRVQAFGELLKSCQETIDKVLVE